MAIRNIRSVIRFSVVLLITHLYLVRFIQLLITKRNGARTPKFDRSIKHFGVLPESFQSVVVMAHYDASQDISAVDKWYLAKLRECTDAVLLVTTSMTETGCLSLIDSDLVDLVMLRENIGFDFASWQTAILEFELHKRDIENLLLVNNSVFCISDSLKCFYDRSRSIADITTATESLEFLKHGQSYWINFNRPVINSHAFNLFWGQFFLYRNKWSIILRGELFLTKFFRSHNFSTGVVIPSRRRIVRNPLTFMYAQLIADGLPFIKKSLFTYNYDRIDMDNWRDAVSHGSSSNTVHLIEQYLGQDGHSREQA